MRPTCSVHDAERLLWRWTWLIVAWIEGGDCGRQRCCLLIQLSLWRFSSRALDTLTHPHTLTLTHSLCISQTRADTQTLTDSHTQLLAREPLNNNQTKKEEEAKRKMKRLSCFDCSLASRWQECSVWSFSRLLYFL